MYQIDGDLAAQALLEVQLHFGSGNAILRPLGSRKRRHHRRQIQSVNGAEDRILVAVVEIAEHSRGFQVGVDVGDLIASTICLIHL